MGLWDSIARVLSGEAKPLLGKAVAERAKKHGVAYLMPDGFPHPGIRSFDPSSKNFADLQLPSAVHRLLKGSDQYARVIAHPRELGKDFQGVLLNVGGREITPQQAARLASAKVVEPILSEPGKWNKYTEMRMLNKYAPEHAPRTLMLDRFAQQLTRRLGRRPSRKQLVEALKKRFGGQFIIKPVDGAASLVGDLATESNALEKFPKGGMRSWGKYLVQERRDLMPTSPLHRAVDSIATFLSPSTRNFARGTHEYRIHALDGRVIPGASSGRGSNLTAYTPHGGEYVEKAEALVNKILKKIPEKRRKHFYGMDVGIDTKGNPFIIEMNPSDPTGTSGFVGSPFMVDALTSAIRGQTSRFNRIKDIGLAGGAVGAGGLAAHLHGKYTGDSDTPDYSNLA